MLENTEKELVYHGRLHMKIQKKIYNDVTVTISDKQHKVPSYKGKMIHQYPQDILCHELVGHAAPKVLGRDTGYAIENGNKVWKELNYPLRKNNEKDKE